MTKPTTIALALIVSSAIAGCIGAELEDTPAELGEVDSALHAQEPSGRLLWNHTGLASVWWLDGSNNYDDHVYYQQTTDWTAKGVTDTHMLWNHSSGMASIWGVDNDGNYSYHRFWGPYPGYEVASITRGYHDVAWAGGFFVMWSHDSGEASIWEMADVQTIHSWQRFGHEPGYRAQSFGRACDGSYRLLFGGPNRRGILWKVEKDASGRWTRLGRTHYIHPSNLGNYNAKSFSTMKAPGGVCKNQVMFGSNYGGAFVYTLDTSDRLGQRKSYQPGGSWTAEALSDNRWQAGSGGSSGYSSSSSSSSGG